MAESDKTGRVAETASEDATVDELKDRLRVAGLSTTGNKDELIARLASGGSGEGVKKHPATGSNPFNDFKRKS